MNDAELLKAVGLSPEELKDRLVNELANRIQAGDADWAGIGQDLTALVESQVNETVQRLAEEHVLPKVNEYIENLCLQETNKWGEKKGEPVSFVEYRLTGWTANRRAG